MRVRKTNLVNIYLDLELEDILSVDDLFVRYIRGLSEGLIDFERFPSFELFLAAIEHDSKRVEVVTENRKFIRATTTNDQAKQIIISERQMCRLYLSDKSDPRSSPDHVKDYESYVSFKLVTESFSIVYYEDDL